MSDEPGTSAPSWSTITEEILCPLCDYNLRGVAEPRCAECGYRFVWSDMLDPKRRHHRFLFEHHPRHGFSSFFRTATASWRPWRFWTTLHPTQPVILKRTIRYWLLCLLPWALYAAAIGGVCFVVLSQDIRALSAGGPIVWTGGIHAYSKQYIYDVYADYSWYRSDGSPIDHYSMLKYVFLRSDNTHFWVIPTILLVCWPVVSFLALHSFAVTMNKAQIKSVHIWRCVVYSGDVVFWLLLALGGTLVGMYVASPMQPEEIIRYLGLFGHVAGWLVLPIGTLRLCVAYRHYLTFERPVATVLLAQAIVFLFYLNVSLIHFWLW